jgi:hypothetical protein
MTSLDSTYSKLTQVKGKVPTQPNDKSHVEMEKRLEGLKKDVEQAWRFQYERQKGFLTWPREAFSLAKTHEIFDSLRPFEKLVPFPLPDKPAPPLDQITERDRDVYRKYIAPEFLVLASKIGSTWKFELDAATMGPGTGGFAPPPGVGASAPGFGGAGSTASATGAGSTDLVRWSEPSQKELATAVLPWFSNPKPPSIHEIYYAQEDIWVLRGLMDIIAQTNADAKENFQAIVREIEWIRMGSRASRDAGTLYASATPAGGMGMPGMGGGPPGGYSAGGSGGPPPGYGGGSGGSSKGGDLGAPRVAVRVDPADGRYVDTNFKPLTGAQLRTAMNLTTANDAVSAVAKRIPIRLRLKVDESQIGRLITECGNGKMMLEVLQVRYNTDPAPAPAAAGTSGGGGPSFGGGDRPSAMGGGGGAGTGSASAGDSGGGGLPGFGGGIETANTAGNGEVAIEIFGLVYLYNPPASLTSTNASASGAGAAGAPSTNGVSAAANTNGGAPVNGNAANAASNVTGNASQPANKPDAVDKPTDPSSDPGKNEGSDVTPPATEGTPPENATGTEGENVAAPDAGNENVPTTPAGSEPAVPGTEGTPPGTAPPAGTQPE